MHKHFLSQDLYSQVSILITMKKFPSTLKVYTAECTGNTLYKMQTEKKHLWWSCAMQYIQNLLFYSRKAQIEAPQSLVLCNWTAEYNFFQIYSLNYFTYMNNQGRESLWYLLEAAFATRFNFAPLYPLLHRLNWNRKKNTWQHCPGRSYLHNTEAGDNVTN